MELIMRIEPFGINSVLHVTNRGVRGADIVRDKDDQERFVQSLFYLNDTHADPYWHRAVADIPLFSRPEGWPKREPIVRILAWTLLSNHFHLVLQEIVEGGVAKFMQRLGGSLSTCFNAKYNEKGSLFQGSYRARLVRDDEHRQYLVFYVLIKNVLEMYPGGLSAAYVNFDRAWEWAVQYPHSSLKDVVTGKPSPIIDDPDNLVSHAFGIGSDLKTEARELLDFYLGLKTDEFKLLMLDR